MRVIIASSAYILLVDEVEVPLLPVVVRVGVLLSFRALYQDIHAAAAREVKTVPVLPVSAGIGAADLHEIACFDACRTVVKRQP